MAVKNRSVDAEIQRLTAILEGSGVSDKRIRALSSVIENVAWMKMKLDDAMLLISDGSVTVPYDNGGGQSGIRENPAFKGYEALWKAYLSGMSKILDCLPPERIEAEIEVVEKPKTMLDIVRDRHRQKA